MTAAQTRILAVLGALVGAMVVATAAVFFLGDSGSPRAGSAGPANVAARSTIPPTAVPSFVPATGSATRSASPTSTPAAPPPRLADVRIRAETAVNVRSGPGTSFPVVGSLQPGDEARATGRNIDGSWLTVDVEPVAGWVATGVVQVTGEPLLLAIVQPTPQASVSPTPRSATTATVAPTTLPTPSPTATGVPNTTTATATRPPAAALPDLVLQDVAAGAGGRITVTIANAGPGPLTARRVSVVGLDEAGSVVFSDLTAPLTLAPGAATTVEVAYSPAAPVTITVILNADGSVDESNVANNRRRVTLNPR